MARFLIDFDGAASGQREHEFPTLDAARDAAIVMLGTYLQHHPEFAYKKHWRVDLKDSDERILMHVMVATVDAPPPLNFRSFRP